MDINQYVKENYNDLYTVCKNITKNHQLTDDLFQHCVIILLEYPTDKMSVIVKNKHVKFFFIGIVINNWSSSTSPFHKTFRNPNTQYIENEIEIEDEPYSDDFEEKLEFLTNMLDKEHWYIQKLVEMKGRQAMSYQQIKELTGIPRSSLFSTFDKFRNKVNKEYNKVKNND